jgi:hypothetical protein
VTRFQETACRVAAWCASSCSRMSGKISSVAFSPMKQSTYVLASTRRACGQSHHAAGMIDRDPDLRLRAPGRISSGTLSQPRTGGHSWSRSGIAGHRLETGAIGVTSDFTPDSLVIDCAPGRIRTCDARFRKPTLYPLSYGGGGWRIPGRKPTPKPCSRGAVLGRVFCWLAEAALGAAHSGRSVLRARCNRLGWPALVCYAAWAVGARWWWASASELTIRAKPRTLRCWRAWPRLCARPR